MLYEVIVRQELNGQICINKMNYVGSGTPAAVSRSFALTDALGFIPSAGVYPAGSVFANWKGSVSDLLRFVSVSVRAIYDDADFYERPFVANVVGSQSGDVMAAFIAYGFRSNRVLQSISRGTRRLAGVVEGQVNTQGNLASGMLTALQTLAEKFSDVLTYDDEGNTITFTPCVVQKERYQSNADPVRFAYRYYASEATQTAHTAVGIDWEVYPEVRSQVSRQKGRGI